MSEREAEELLRAFLRRGAATHDSDTGPVLVNLAFLRAAADADAGAGDANSSHLADCHNAGPALQLPRGSQSAAVWLDACTLAALSLFAGEAQFAGSQRKSALETLLPSRSAARSALEVLKVRETELLFEQSHLETIVRRAEVQHEATAE